MKKPQIINMTNAELLTTLIETVATLTGAKMLNVIGRSPNGIRHVEAKFRQARKEVELLEEEVLRRMITGRKK